MAKLTLTDLTSLANETSVINAINNNNQATEVALENTLSRDGTSPNEMEANLDMNNNRIINLPDAVADQEPITKAQLDAAIIAGISDAELLALASTTSAANKLPYFTGSGTATTTDLSSFARTLLDDTSATAMQATLGVREVLTATRNYYVRTDGSDSNNGLANTSGGAFLTIQKAVDVACAIDASTQNVNINIATGTYTGTVTLKKYLGSGIFSIIGTSVTINGGTSNGITAYDVGTWVISGITFTNTSNSIIASGSTVLQFGSGMSFGSATDAHVLSQSGAYVIFNNDYSITGGANTHLQALQGFIQVVGITVTLTGTPAFSGYFAHSQFFGHLKLFSTTWSGSATGTRYLSYDNSLIVTNGGGATYLPGNASGITGNQGLYT